MLARIALQDRVNLNVEQDFVFRRSVHGHELNLIGMLEQVTAVAFQAIRARAVICLKLTILNLNASMVNWKYGKTVVDPCLKSPEEGALGHREARTASLKQTTFAQRR